MVTLRCGAPSRTVGKHLSDRDEIRVASYTPLLHCYISSAFVSSGFVSNAQALSLWAPHEMVSRVS